MWLGGLVGRCPCNISVGLEPSAVVLQLTRGVLHPRLRRLNRELLYTDDLQETCKVRINTGRDSSSISQIRLTMRSSPSKILGLESLNEAQAKSLGLIS